MASYKSSTPGCRLFTENFRVTIIILSLLCGFGQARKSVWKSLCLVVNGPLHCAITVGESPCPQARQPFSTCPATGGMPGTAADSLHQTKMIKPGFLRNLPLITHCKGLSNCIDYNLFNVHTVGQSARVDGRPITMIQLLCMFAFRLKMRSDLEILESENKCMFLFVLDQKYNIVVFL